MPVEVTPRTVTFANTEKLLLDFLKSWGVLLFKKERRTSQTTGRITLSTVDHHNLLVALLGRRIPSACHTEKSSSIKLREIYISKTTSYEKSKQAPLFFARSYHYHTTAAADKERSWPHVTELQSRGFKGQSRIKLTSQPGCSLQPGTCILPPHMKCTQSIATEHPM